MRLLLDQGLPRSPAQLLRACGIDAVHVGEVELATAPDAAVIAHAVTEHRVVVTLDCDFHTHLAITAASGPSIIRIREEGLRAAALVSLLIEVLATCQADLETGAAITVQGRRVRVRALPLRP